MISSFRRSPLLLFFFSFLIPSAGAPSSPLRSHYSRDRRGENIMINFVTCLLYWTRGPSGRVESVFSPCSPCIPHLNGIKGEKESTFPFPSVRSQRWQRLQTRDVMKERFLFLLWEWNWKEIRGGKGEEKERSGGKEERGRKVSQRFWTPRIVSFDFRFGFSSSTAVATIALFLPDKSQD